TQGIRAETLAEDRSSTANRHLQTAPGQTGGDPQIRRRNAKAWHSFGSGPVAPTGDVAGLAAPLRSDVLRSQLRLPPGAQCPSGGGEGSGIPAGRLAVGGGHGPGEILRPCEP